MQHEGRSPGSGQQPPDLFLLQAKVDMMFGAIREIKDAIRAIENTVGLLRVFDMQSKQQNIDIGRLEESLNSLRANLGEQERKYAEVQRTLQTELETKIGDVRKLAEGTEGKFNNRMSYVQGGLAAVTVLGALLYGIAGWLGSRYIDMTEENDRFIHTLKTLEVEDHLRGSMGSSAKPHVLDRKPNVVSPQQADHDEVPKL